jgi:hypothetical protein
MDRTLRHCPIACLFLLLVVECAPRPFMATGTTTPGYPTSDSVTVRTMFKAWGGGYPNEEECYEPTWGWDTLTVRARPGDSIRVFGNWFNIRLGKTFPPDSASLVYPAEAFFTLGHSTNKESPALDSVMITSTPRSLVARNLHDGGAGINVSIIPTWPVPTPPSIRGGRLVGRVVDDSTHQSIEGARIVVLNTKLQAGTDKLGRFTLPWVPQGQVRLGVCAGAYLRSDITTRVPRRALLVGLRRDPRIPFVR